MSSRWARSTQDWSPKTSTATTRRCSCSWATTYRRRPGNKQYAPELAESWELSEDGMTWTFQFRQGVRFHGGWGEMTAEDVRYSWEMWTSEESRHVAAPSCRRAIDDDMANFEIVSDYEFRLHASEPTPDLLSAVCSCEPGMTIFSKAYHDAEASRPRRRTRSSPGRGSTSAASRASSSLCGASRTTGATSPSPRHSR